MFGGLFGHKQQNEQPVQPQPRVYKMREHLLTFGHDYNIENEHGQRVFQVDNKVLRIRDTIVFKDHEGKELLRLQEKWLPIRDTMNIYQGKEVFAKVKQAIIAPLRERYTIEVASGDNLTAQGDIFNHEYDIERNNFPIAQVSKRWFRVRDTFGVQVGPTENDILILAITACIDTMSRGDKD